MPDAGWSHGAEYIYAGLEGRPRLRAELDAIDDLIDLIEADPTSARAREQPVVSPRDKSVYWKVTQQAGEAEVAVLWQMVGHRPVIAWLGHSDYRSLF